MSLRHELIAVVGSANVLTDPELVAGYIVDWTGRWHGTATMVVRPETTAEVAAVVERCRDLSAVIVPQGGNTGLVGGAVPAPTMGPPVVVLSLRRLNAVEPVDLMAAQVTVGAGVTLAQLHDNLSRARTGLEFAVDMASRGSATIGGMIATNAGGIHVVRHGGMRAQVSGLEAVLADGSVISRLDGLVKDNTGYDLSQLIVGSEGTLGIVTRARLKLVPSLPARYTALLALDDTQQAVDLISEFRRSTASLEAAEIFYPDGLALVQRHAGLAPPFPRSYGAYLLVECAGRDDAVLDDLAGLAESVGAEAAAVGLDGPSRQRLWEYRERHTEAVNALGVPHKLDVTLPLSHLAQFETDVRAVVAALEPSATVIIWGHVGDGNLHVNVVGPDAADDSIDDAVLRLVAQFGGSISAEHGIGRAKIAWLPLTRSPAEVAAMTAIKLGLDPARMLNPGVIISSYLT
ncbi:MAG TPA: FAD-binding oxidoreductase [Acidimicrobiales bacterium]|nr:FAD-binding oxidoreductase [Acidimicrobiales bacterium]